MISWYFSEKRVFICGTPDVTFSWEPGCAHAWLNDTTFKVSTRVAYGGHQSIPSRLTSVKEETTSLIESKKTTPMEMLVQEYLMKIKNNIWDIKIKTKKLYDAIIHIQLHLSKVQTNEDSQSTMSNLQPSCCLKADFQKKWTNIQDASG